MRRPLLACMFAAIAVGSSVPAGAGQAVSVPLSISVTASPTEVSPGSLTAVTVQLRNYRGNPVPAADDVVVTLHSEQSADTSVVVSAGQSGAATKVAFIQPGVATLVASAANFVSGTTSVVVVGSREEPAAPARPPIGAAAAGAPRTAAAPPPSVPGSKINLAVTVLPEHVHPTNASWRATILVTAVDDNEQPVQVETDTPIQLSTDVGDVTPTMATIAVGHARTTEQIQLTSSKAGEGNVWAWTDAGALGRATFEDHQAVPAQVAVKAVPARTLNDGRTEIHVSVFLQDDTSTATKADGDTQVKVTSSIGTITPSIVSIPKGQFVGEAVLTSATAGKAEITAMAPGLRPGLASVAFVFPTALVLVAGLGGLIGSLLRSTDLTFTGQWWHHLGGSLVIGAVLGLLFYLLAMFGIVASIPKLSIPLNQLPTTNELAALVLGFFGGYYARSWLPDPRAETPAPSAPADHQAV